LQSIGALLVALALEQRFDGRSPRVRGAGQRRGRIV
jgi:hypothetical protein